MRATSAAFACRRWERLRFGGLVGVSETRIGRSYWKDGDIVTGVVEGEGGERRC